ncbi:hypothetical protein Ahy_A08g038229 [Arachis hypogaea]|uniref:Uncharacterized protein n=1 Tax=Arachis hypogaea TaxID=3818 RepID=A0A445BSY1_ARAHY|nr:hypothetical protein Ahy_A08g038229 [Arachis hypogaea]
MLCSAVFFCRVVFYLLRRVRSSSHVVFFCLRGVRSAHIMFFLFRGVRSSTGVMFCSALPCSSARTIFCSILPRSIFCLRHSETSALLRHMLASASVLMFLFLRHRVLEGLYISLREYRFCFRVKSGNNLCFQKEEGRPQATTTYDKRLQSTVKRIGVTIIKVKCDSMKAENNATGAQDMQKELQELKLQYKKLKIEHSSFHDIADKMIEEKDNEISRLSYDNRNLRQSLQSRPHPLHTKFFRSVPDHSDNDNYNTASHEVDSMNLCPSAAEQQILSICVESFLHCNLFYCLDNWILHPILLSAPS